MLWTAVHMSSPFTSATAGAITDTIGNRSLSSGSNAITSPAGEAASTSAENALALDSVSGASAVVTEAYRVILSPTEFSAVAMKV